MCFQEQKHAAPEYFNKFHVCISAFMLNLTQMAL